MREKDTEGVHEDDAEIEREGDARDMLADALGLRETLGDRERDLLGLGEKLLDGADREADALGVVLRDAERERDSVEVRLKRRVGEFVLDIVVDDDADDDVETSMHCT